MSKGKFTTWLYIDPEGDEHTIEVSWSGYYEAAKLDGPMEDCYPASGGLEIDRVTMTSPWPKDLSEAEFKAAWERDIDRLEDLAWDDYLSW